MKFPAVTFLLLSVSAPLPSIASHRPVTRHQASVCIYTQFLSPPSAEWPVVPSAGQLGPG